MSPAPHFTALSVSILREQTGYSKPYFFSPSPVKVSSSALEVMTDLRFVPAATIQASADIETATQKMIARGVRSLLVVDEADDVTGILTARDLMGHRTLDVMESSQLELHQIPILQVMTAANDIEVISLEAVLHARVGDIIETLKNSGRQHAMAVEVEPSTGKAMIRGIFSASQIARQLGIGAPRNDLSQTFAEIDRAIGSQAPN